MDENSSFQKQEAPFEHSDALVASSLLDNSIHGQKASALDYKKESSLQMQAEESDILDDDVKVCDICGDAGREEMLAICSRCSDGAEHIYCMRIMLDKVPEVEWLCEECQIKEMDQVQAITSPTKALHTKENSNEGSLHSKLLPQLVCKEEESELKKVSKVAEPSLPSAKKLAEKFEDSSKKRKLVIDTGLGALGTDNLGKKPALSRESSLKAMDAGKAKQCIHLVSSGIQVANNSKELIRSSSTADIDSYRVPSHLLSPQRLLSRSATFNRISSKPKVKLLAENAFLKQKVGRESSAGVKKKEGLVAKSVSSKIPNSVPANMIGSKMKIPSNFPPMEDSSASKQTKENNVIEGKNSFKMDHSVASLSSSAVANASLPKANSKPLFHSEGPLSTSSLKNAYELSGKMHDGNSYKSCSSLAHKGSDEDVVLDGCGDIKQHSSAHSANPISKGNHIPAERKSHQADFNEETTAGSCAMPHVAVQVGSRQSHESTNQDVKTKGSFRSSKQVTSTTGKSIRCRKCNELGHSVQNCSASNLRISALKASAVRISGEGSKWKDALETLTRTKRKGTNLLEQSDALPSCTDLVGAVAPKDQLSSSAGCMGNLSSLEGTSDSQEALKSSTSDPGRTMAIIGDELLTETCARGEFTMNTIASFSDELKMHQISSQVSLTTRSLSVSAIPEHECIWQGGFELCRSGNPSLYYGGIQAHMSTCASRRVLDVVNKFPRKIQLEEVPQVSSWPLLFQDKATEDNIALFFFAEDLESYEKNYKKLLNYMLKSDLALKGNVNNFEITILTSNHLPVKSQRWNRLLFLWAVFKERRVSCLESLSGSGSQKRIYGTNLNSDPSVYSHGKSEYNSSQKDLCYSQEDNEVSPFDNSAKAPDVATSTTVNLPCLSSTKKGDGKSFYSSTIIDQKPMVFHECDDAATNDGNSSEKQPSTCVPEINSSTSISQLTSLHDGSSLSSISTANEQICSGVKDSTKEVFKDPHSEGKLAVFYSDTSECKQARESLGIANGQDISPLCAKLVRPGSSLLTEHAGSKDALIDSAIDVEGERREEVAEEQSSLEDLRSSRNHPHSKFPETVLDSSCESTKGTLQMLMTWNEKVETCLQVSEEKSCKEFNEIYNDVSNRSSSCDQVFTNVSSKPFELENKPHIVADPNDQTIDLENSRTMERHLFPFDAGHTKDLKSGNTIPLQILSSDEEDSPGTDAPNLELALGAEKKQPKRGASPFLDQLVDGKNKRNNLLKTLASGDNDDDLSSSLSLSLSFPFSKTEQPTGSATRTEQLLPSRRQVNSSLLLSGRFTET